MIPEIGHFALILALCVALVQGILPIYGAAVGNSALMSVAKPAARTQFLLVLTAFGCLAYAFADKDFSVLYVAATSNSQLAPCTIALAAIWGAHEGISPFVDLHPDHLDVCGHAFLRSSSRSHAFPDSWGHGFGERGVPPVHVERVQSVRTADSCGSRRA